MFIRTVVLFLVLLRPLAAGAQKVSGGTPVSLTTARQSRADRPGRDSTAARHRGPIVAGVLGVIPGLGHVYAGEVKRGLAVHAVSLVGGFAALNSSNRFVSGTGGVLILGSEVFSIADATLAAVRFNQRQARRGPGR